MEHLPHDLDLEARRDAFLATYHEEVVTVTTEEAQEVWAQVRARKAATTFSALETLHEADTDGEEVFPAPPAPARYAYTQR